MTLSEGILNFMPHLLSLFDGTGSIGVDFRRAGWDITSVDIDGSHGATVVTDIRLWDYKSSPCPDVIWAGPPCEQYSLARTRAKLPRNLALADELVRTAWEIISYYLHQNPRLLWFVENPLTSQLWRRQVADVIEQRTDLSYCSYGTLYQKKTRIAHNSSWRPRAICSAETCPYYRRHPMTAQKGPSSKQGPGDLCSLDQLHAYPAQLAAEVFELCQAHVG